MSRCFPFPSPEYEKRLRVEDVNLLAKEKDKERKHKKVKNRERKEGREKDKDRSREKHKERDKDKHKHKERDKNNEKKHSHHEKRFEGDGSNVEKLGSNSPQSSCVQVLEQRTNNFGGATGIEFDQLANGQTDSCLSKFPEVPFAFSDGGEQRKVQISRPTENIINKSTERKETQEKHNSNKNEFNYTKIDTAQEVADVRELEQRIRDQNRSTGSHGGLKVDVTMQRRAWSSGEAGNGNGISYSKTKEDSILRNDTYRLENGHNDNNLSDIPRVAVVHNLKAEERGREVVGNVDTSKKSRMQGMEMNGYSGKGVVDNRKKLQFEGVERNKPRKEEKETENVVKVSRFSENGSHCRKNSKHYTSKMGNKAAEAITGKRKEPDANGVLQYNKSRPNKFQKTVLSPQPVTENGRNLITCPTVTLSASKQAPATDLKLEGEEHKSNWNVGAQSRDALTNCPSVRMKPMGTTHDKSPLGSTKPSISSMANGILGSHGSHFVPTKPISSAGKVHGLTGSREPPSVSATAGKINGTVVAHGNPLGLTKPPSSIGRVNGMTSSQESPLVSISTGKVNGTMTAHRSPFGQKKSPMSTVHGMTGTQESPLVSSTAGKVNETIKAHGSPLLQTKPPSSTGNVHETSFQESHGGLLTAGKVNGTIVAHGSPLGPIKPSLSSEKVHGKKGSQKFFLVSSTEGKVNGTIGDHGLAKPPVASGKVNGIIERTLKRSSTSGKEKHKEKSSSKPRPPHPDTKYLTRILSVPKMELPEYDDPEWLFESKSCPSKDLEVGFGRDGGEQVWSKAVYMDAVDIYALPYVIPY